MERKTDKQSDKHWPELLSELLDEKDTRSNSAAAKYILEFIHAVRLKNYLHWLGKTEFQ